MIVKEKFAKEPKGKLISIKVVLKDDGIIDDFIVTGDFFAYPPEVIDDLSRAVRGINILDRKFIELVKDHLNKVTLVGTSKELFMKLINDIIAEVKSCVKK